MVAHLCSWLLLMWWIFSSNLWNHLSICRFVVVNKILSNHNNSRNARCAITAWCATTTGMPVAKYLIYSPGKFVDFYLKKGPFCIIFHLPCPGPSFKTFHLTWSIFFAAGCTYVSILRLTTPPPPPPGLSFSDFFGTCSGNCYGCVARIAKSTHHRYKICIKPTHNWQKLGHFEGK